MVSSGDTECLEDDVTVSCVYGLSADALHNDMMSAVRGGFRRLRRIIQADNSGEADEDVEEKHRSTQAASPKAAFGLLAVTLAASAAFLLAALVAKTWCESKESSSANEQEEPGVHKKITEFPSVYGKE